LSPFVVNHSVSGSVAAKAPGGVATVLTLVERGWCHALLRSLVRRLCLFALSASRDLAVGYNWFSDDGFCCCFSSFVPRITVF
jgi:hypothetical protein